jgi:hypothetical protein
LDEVGAKIVAFGIRFVLIQKRVPGVDDAPY